MERRKKASTKLSIKVVKRKKIINKAVTESNQELEIAKTLEEKKQLKRKKSEKKEALVSPSDIEPMDAYEKIEKSKKVIMWSGVTFFMILVLVFWAYNMKQVFIATKIESENKSGQMEDWKEMTGDIASQLGEIKEVITEFKGKEDGVIAEEEKTENETLEKISNLPENDTAELLNGTTTAEVAGTSTDLISE